MKKIIQIVLTTIPLLLLGPAVFSQGNPLGNVFVGNDISGNAILIKWVMPGFVSPDGFNIYRQEEGQPEWQLMTSSPVVKMPELELDAADRDDGIIYLEDYIEKSDLAQADPFTLLLLSRKLVELNDFASYLGLFYEDDVVRSGGVYRYKVTKIQRNNERLVGMSDLIEVKPFEPIDPPRDIDIFIDEEQDTLVKVFWEPEETRYFAVNIFRAPKGDSLLKINENPAIPTLITNEAGQPDYPDFFYDNGDHEVGTTYTYKLKALDFFGRDSKDSPPFDIEIVDRTPPPPPTDLQTVRTGPRDVRVTWAASYAENLVGYDVFVSDSVNGVFIKANEDMLPVSQTEYVYAVKGEKWGDYFFYVEAINALGTRSPSTKMGLTVFDVVPPPAPTGVMATGMEGAIEISWDSMPEPDLMGYVVYRSVSNREDTPFMLVSGGAIDTTAFVDSLPREARNEYFYKVAAVDLYGNLSERSEVAVAVMPDVIAPPAPTIIRIDIENDTASITWLPSIDDELKGYHLYRATGIDTLQWESIDGNSLPSYATEFTDTGLEPNTTYSYQLTAEDESGNISEPSNRYSVRTLPDHGEDLAPARIEIDYTRRKKLAVVSWEPVSAPNAEGSILYRKIGNGRFFPLTGLLTEQSEYTDQDMVPETTYTYQLRTFYNNGNITRSEPVEVLAR